LKFFDKDFGPVNSSDLIGSGFSMYKKGAVPSKGYPKPTECEWVFSEELCDPGEKP